MKIRALIYWVVTFVVAAYAAEGLSASAPEVEASLMPASHSISSILAVPDAARSALLFIGIVAVAYTYQRAWANFRSGPAA